MTYSSATDVKDRVGIANIPSAITDSMIFIYIEGSDAYIDDRTQSTFAASYTEGSEDNNVNRGIREISILLSAAKLRRRLAGTGKNYKLGDLSVGKKELLALAQTDDMEAERMLVEKPVAVRIKLTNE